MHRIAEKETLLQDGLLNLQSLKQALGASEAHERGLLSDLNRKQKDIEETKCRLHEVEQLLENARSDIALRIQK